MPPIRVNRRRFLGCSAAASLALSQGNLAEAAGGRGRGRPVRLGVIGVGNRGTALLAEPCSSCRALRSSRSATPSPSTGCAGRGSSRRRAASGPRRTTTRGACSIGRMSTRSSSRCRATSTSRSIATRSRPASTSTPRSRWRLSLAGLRSPGRTGGEGPEPGGARRLPAAVEPALSRRRSSGSTRGELGPLVEARAAWTSSNGPMTGHGGWLGRRERSGDWMVEQAVHVWDVLHWIKGELPARASGWGRRGLFAGIDPAPRRDRPLFGRARMGRRLPRLVRRRAGSRRPTTASPARRSACWARTAGFDFSTGIADVPRPIAAAPDDPRRPAGRFPAGARSVPRRGASRESARLRRSPWPTPAPRRSSACWPARRSMREGSSRSMRSRSTLSCSVGARRRTSPGVSSATRARCQFCGRNPA